MSLVRQIDKKFSYQDYLTWPDDERREIIDGAAIDMTPSPKRKHQILSLNLTFKIKEKLNANEYLGCRLYEAPMDVIFDDYNVVQPDIFIVCDKNKDTDYIVDVPKLIIEIISKSTAYKDTKIKKDLYEKFGVGEYIIVYPDFQMAERYVLDNNRYGAPERFNWNETLKLKTFDIKINLWEIFEKEPELNDNKDKQIKKNKP